MYGYMEAFAQKLRDMEFQDVRLIDTAQEVDVYKRQAANGPADSGTKRESRVFFYGIPRPWADSSMCDPSSDYTCRKCRAFSSAGSSGSEGFVGSIRRGLQKQGKYDEKELEYERCV